MLGFLMMFIVLCIVVGQSGFDRGKTLRGRDEARAEGKDWYIDGNGLMRSVYNKHHIDRMLTHGCNFLYDCQTHEIIKDYNLEECKVRNEQLSEEGKKGHLAVVWHTIIHNDKTKINIYNVGNVWVSIENETNRPYMLDYNWSTKQGAKYYFKDDKVEVYYGNVKKPCKLCNLDATSRVELSSEEYEQYKLPRVVYLEDTFVCSDGHISGRQFNPYSSDYGHVYFIKE